MKQQRHAGSGARQAPQAKSSPQAVTPGVEEGSLEVQIREAAYFRYLARGAEVGHEMEDWLWAEAGLLESGKADDTTH